MRWGAVFLAALLASPAQADFDKFLGDDQIKAMADCVDQGGGATCIGMFFEDCVERVSTDVAANALKAATWCLEEEADFWEDRAGGSPARPSPDACPTNMSEDEQQESWAIAMRDNELAECRRDSLAQQALVDGGKDEERPEDEEGVAP